MTVPIPRPEMTEESDVLDWWETAVASFYETVGAQVNGAALVRTIVADLREIRKAAEETPLSLVDAAERSGYTPDHIGRLVREGKIPNAGRANSPKVRARDLPTKTKKKLAGGAALAYNPDADARSLVSTRR